MLEFHPRFFPPSFVFTGLKLSIVLFLCGWCRDDDIHQHGVAIMLSREAARALINWTPIDERIIRARFHSRHVKLTLIHAYAPTNDADEESKDHFYEKLQVIVEKTQKHDILVITGDLNAKVGNDAP